MSNCISQTKHIRYSQIINALAAKLPKKSKKKKFQGSQEFSAVLPLSIAIYKMKTLDEMYKYGFYKGSMVIG